MQSLGLHTHTHAHMHPSIIQSELLFPNTQTSLTVFCPGTEKTFHLYDFILRYFISLESEKSDFSVQTNHLHVCVLLLRCTFLLSVKCETSACLCLFVFICVCVSVCVSPPACTFASLGMEGPMSHRAPLGPPSAARFHRRRTSGTRDERYRSGTEAFTCLRC